MTKPAQMPANARTVKAHLMHFGKDTAQGIRHTLGISHEALYVALVWLEGRGLAVLYSHRPDHNKRGVVYWEAV